MSEKKNELEVKKYMIFEQIEEFNRGNPDAQHIFSSIAKNLNLDWSAGSFQYDIEPPKIEHQRVFSNLTLESFKPKNEKE